VRRKRFKSLDGWYQFPIEPDLVKRQKKYPDGRWFIEYYDTRLRRTMSSGWTIAVLERLSSRNAIAMEQDMDLLKKALEARKKAVKTAAEYEPEGWLAKTPLIEAMLKQLTMDGKPRQTSTLNLSWNADGCKIMLKDRQAKEVTWGTGETFLDALVALEERLSEGTAQWQPDLFNESNGKKK